MNTKILKLVEKIGFGITIKVCPFYGVTVCIENKNVLMDGHREETPNGHGKDILSALQDFVQKLRGQELSWYGDDMLRKGRNNTLYRKRLPADLAI